MTTDRPAPGAVVLRLRGRLDAAAAADFEAALLPLAEDPDVRLIVLDGDGLDYIASAGLRGLLKAVKAMKARGAPLRGARLGPSVVSVLRMTGFLAFIEVKPTVEEALA